jgi:hypothetical protein
MVLTKKDKAYIFLIKIIFLNRCVCIIIKGVYSVMICLENIYIYIKLSIDNTIIFNFLLLASIVLKVLIILYYDFM